MEIGKKKEYEFTLKTSNSTSLTFTTVEFDNNKNLYFYLKTLKSIFKLSTIQILTSLDYKYNDDDNPILIKNYDIISPTIIPDIAIYDDDGKTSSKMRIIVEVKYVLKLCDKYLDRDNVRLFRDYIIETLLPIVDLHIIPRVTTKLYDHTYFFDEKIYNECKHYIEEYDKYINKNNAKTLIKEC